MLLERKLGLSSTSQASKKIPYIQLDRAYFAGVVEIDDDDDEDDDDDDEDQVNFWLSLM